MKALNALALGLCMALAMTSGAEAASKKKGRDAYTKEQQKKFHEQGLKACRKTYGTQLHYVRIDYSKSRPRIWCYHY